VPPSSSRRALILGGTGAIGGATAQRLAEHGWEVTVTGREPQRMPRELAERGVRFHAVDRSDLPALTRLAGDSCDLLVDLLAYTASDVEDAVPLYRTAASIVVASSRAVYVDSVGNHINADTPPRYPVPIPEANPTLPPLPAGASPFSREGYGPGKAAVERAALDSGLPVTVLRPSKVHGRWARNARTRDLVERMVAGVDTIELARGGSAIDHLTAATNTAAIIEVVADDPAARVLNTADPDPLTALAIVEAIGRSVEWRGRVIGLADDAPGGAHPWSAAHPIVLDMSAAQRLGYRPEGTAESLLAEEATWIAGSLPRTRR
jgi:nucleoside-diphosphate-sugar epimerase